MTDVRAPRVLALAVVKDDWPMLELAVTHVLLHHADEVVVVDHASCDGTAAGLARMATRWDGRLRILQASQPEFWQEAMVAAALGAVGAAERFDWVYPFDADEFLLTGPGGLRAAVGPVPVGVQAVRYELHNWLAPRTFDMDRLGDYASLRARAVPTVLAAAPGADRAKAVAAGELNFFDLPFPTKVIFRPADAWLAAGSHHLKGPAGAITQSVPSDVVRAAHLPLVSLRRLQKKARHGRRLIDSGFGPDHGWQNQMLARLDAEGRLDEFWVRHCADPPADISGPLPTLVEDGAFSAQLAAALEALARAGEAELTRGAEADVLPPHAVALARRLQLAADHEREAAERARDAQRVSEADRQTLGAALEAERAAAARRQTLVGELEVQGERLRRAVAAREAELTELRAALARCEDERDGLQAELRDLARRYHVLVSSKSWRLTAPIRRARRRGRRRAR